jgi:hypothetical protein
MTKSLWVARNDQRSESRETILHTWEQVTDRHGSQVEEANQLQEVHAAETSTWHTVVL